MLRRIRSQTASLNVGDCVLDLWGVPAAVGGEARVGLSGWLSTFHAGVGWMRLFAASRPRRRPTHPVISLLSGGGATV